MAESDTARLGLRRWTAGTDTPARTEFDTAHANLEDRVAGFTKGTIAARPAASAAFDRWFYLATDEGDAPGALYFCDGSVWTIAGTGAGGGGSSGDALMLMGG